MDIGGAVTSGYVFNFKVSLFAYKFAELLVAVVSWIK